MSNSAILHRTSTLFHPENRHPLPDSDVLSLHHIHASVPGRSSSAVVHHILAPVAAVWSIVRRFDSPHSYKHFIKSCDLLDDSGELRRVHVVSGLPAATSVERLEVLDDERHVIGFRVVGGDHRLANYRSVTTCHAVGGDRTVVVESYVVDTPEGNTEEETCLFVDTIVRCNLQSLAKIAHNMHEKK